MHQHNENFMWARVRESLSYKLQLSFSFRDFLHGVSFRWFSSELGAETS
jgi:hypothetical protein